MLHYFFMLILLIKKYFALPHIYFFPYLKVVLLPSASENYSDSPVQLVRFKENGPCFNGASTRCDFRTR